LRWIPLVKFHKEISFFQLDTFESKLKIQVSLWDLTRGIGVREGPPPLSFFIILVPLPQNSTSGYFIFKCLWINVNKLSLKLEQSYMRECLMFDFGDLDAD
jgi:hypothetical protein